MRVFVDAGGQHDNVGDSALRRAYLDALRPIGELHVLAATPEDYLTGLQLRPEDRLYTAPQHWRSAARTNLLRGPICFAYNSGELRISELAMRRRPSAEQVIARLAHLRGGLAVMAGNSVRPGFTMASTFGARNARTASVVSWRDQWSADQAGRGVVNPDWAFALGGSASLVRTSGRRRIIAVAMRGDRPSPSPQWYSQVAAFAAEQSCELRVVVQVRRDSERAAEVAAELDADLLDWPDAESHRTREARLRHCYRDSLAVIGDRAHALIIGLTEGAVPIGVTTSSPEKVRRLFGVVSTLPIAPDEVGDDPQRWRLLLDSRPQLADELAAARQRLDALREHLLAAAG